MSISKLPAVLPASFHQRVSGRSKKISLLHLKNPCFAGVFDKYNAEYNALTNRLAADLATTYESQKSTFPADPPKKPKRVVEEYDSEDDYDEEIPEVPQEVLDELNRRAALKAKKQPKSGKLKPIAE